ncbi:DUF4910 domain-containing protein [Simkania negevensis]|uniref:DUF4910 domain-containing protein n=1 Tax=Simkania negevensis TaxID=83561 RepID=A0ABS3ASI0_9BACT|nr:DUF4910 domain-containing protein [Simkania negevensis]
MLEILKALCHLNRNFCSKDYDASLSYLGRRIPLTVHRFCSGTSCNGWEIPPKWDLSEAYISLDGEKLYEVSHPLQLIGLSAPFEGRVSQEELKSHLHYDVRHADALPYHFRQNYRPWERTWGFCVSKTFYDSLAKGIYDVVIRTEESSGYLDVAECRVEGKYPDTFSFVAHLDHPGMANDDLAGVAVGVELFRRLQKRKTKFSYQLLLVQEIVGSEFFLSQLPERSNYTVEGLFLEMLGSDTELALQHSMGGKSNLERAVKEALDDLDIPHRTGPFKSIVCNDESVFESYGIPMASLSRFPYPEYHSSLDTIDIIKESALEESVVLLERAIDLLEKTILVVKKFHGTPCLSHPSYNLYIDPGQRAFGQQVEEEVLKRRLLADILPTLSQRVSVQQLAEQVGLDAATALADLVKWEEKGLIALTGNGEEQDKQDCHDRQDSYL